MSNFPSHKSGMALTESILHVHSRGGTLENTECLDDRRRHTVLGLVDLEVAQGTISISVPEVHTLSVYSVLRSI